MTALTRSVRWFIIALFAAILSAPPTTAMPAADIINGSPAKQGQFPWMAGVFHTVHGNQQFCGAVLISDEWLLTAAHCVYGATNFQIILGAARAFDDEPGKIKIGVRKAVYHPLYNEPAPLNNDIALLQLNSKVNYTSIIQPIRLAHSRDYLKDNAYVTISGWGKTSDQQNAIVNNLNYVQLRTISNDDCKKWFVPQLIQDYIVCCDGSQYLSICNGDDGGPLYTVDGDGWPTLVAIASFASINGCAKGWPSGFTRVAPFISFINGNTGLNFP